MPRLEANALTLTAGDKLLVRDLAVAFDAGQNWAILGANGSGKTTLLHTLAGLHRPAQGEVRRDGQPLTATAHRERARAIGLLFQDSSTLFPATVLETVLTGRHPHLGRWQSEGPADRDAAEAALAAVGLTDFAHRSLTSCPAASAGAWNWQRCSRRTRRSACSTSRSAISTCITR
jgi:iron complex transport system ATP-binding protein